MPYVHIVIALALIEFFYFCVEVGRARTRYKVQAPATTGNEVFERYFRVQMNTLEQLIMFVPAILIFSLYMSPYVAAAIGAVYVIGRIVYLLSYVKNPKSRSAGYALSILPTLILLAGGLFGAIRAALHG
jgi:glutathione S-transferase